VTTATTPAIDEEPQGPALVRVVPGNDTAPSIVLSPALLTLLQEEQASDEAELADLERMRKRVTQRMAARAQLLSPGGPKKAYARTFKVRVEPSEEDLETLRKELLRNGRNVRP
jgi:hypothetical protein